jgi:hypothetical protein
VWRTTQEVTAHVQADHGDVVGQQEPADAPGKVRLSAEVQIPLIPRQHGGAQAFDLPGVAMGQALG